MVCVFHLAWDEDMSGVSGVGRSAVSGAGGVDGAKHAGSYRGRDRESHEYARRHSWRKADEGDGSARSMR